MQQQPDKLTTNILLNIINYISTNHFSHCHKIRHSQVLASQLIDYFKAYERNMIIFGVLTLARWIVGNLRD